MKEPINLLTGILIPFQNARDGMQDSDNEGIPLNEIRPFIIRSLRRSSIRKKIVDYLFEISPSGSYSSEIAYKV
jgi:hypothetical protein